MNWWSPSTGAILPGDAWQCACMPRKAYRFKKRHFLPPGCTHDQEPPDWWKRATRGELCKQPWLDLIGPGRAGHLQTYIGLEDCGLCATGRVHPEDVQRYVTRQLTLDWNGNT